MKKSQPRHPTLQLPNPIQTLFLRACLAEGDVARESWKEWRARIGDPRTFFASEFPAARRLLALLHFNLRRNEIEVQDAWLKAARVREKARGATFWSTSGQILSALNGQAVSFILGKGAAIDAFGYPHLGLRHTHDLDLIVQDAESAAAALENLKRVGDLRFEDDSGLPVALHAGLFCAGNRDIDMDAVWRRTREKTIFNTRVRLLSPEDQLLQILEHASHASPGRSGHWVCDAWFVIGREGMDWDALAARAEILGLTLAVTIGLKYLTDELGAVIPDEALGQLAALAGHAAIPAFPRAGDTARVPGPGGSLRDRWGGVLGRWARFEWLWNIQRIFLKR